MNGPQTSPAASPTGLLVIDKPLGKTSMQVCAAVRARLRAAGAPKRIKVGHAGTLDPLATGVLVVLVGKATKQQDRYMAGRKGYVAGVDLAHVSRTDDAEGPVEAVECAPVTREQIERALPGFTGTIEQRPPAYSAMKLGGRRAYALARQAETADEMPTLEPRPVVIESLEVLAFDWPVVTLAIGCGKGTYIRSLARDLGVELGVGGMLRSLRRTRVGGFTLDDAVTLDDLPDRITQGDLRPLE
ncbi:MAG: tRNA pseudouridine(55) synthase TruB [Planctomycetota bacterium]